MDVVTLTLNPCIDLTKFADDFDEMPESVAIQTGGKGINVARVLGNLGINALAVCPLGGETGKRFLELANQEGINISHIEARAPTRVIVTRVRKRDLAQQVDYVRGGELAEAELDDMEKLLFSSLSGARLLAICGSASCDSAAKRVPGIIQRAREMGVKVLLDSNGNALTLGAEALPDLIKPNEAELFELTGISGDISRAARVLIGRGIGGVLASLSSTGCMLATNDGEEYCPAPKVETVNPVGSGDSFVAGFIFAMENNYAIQAALMIACAAGAANAAVFPAARVTRGEIEKLLGWKLPGADEMER